MAEQPEILRYFLIGLAAWNVTVCIIYGVDKKRSLSNAWRISERGLLSLAFFLGGAGALAGMRIFHHKTLHRKFTVGVPLCIISNIIVVIILMFPDITYILIRKTLQ